MNKTLLTDLYQLTMNAAYFYNSKDDPAVYDLYIRAFPQDWGYLIVNGIEDAIDYVTSIEFSEEDISYLKTQGFENDYLKFLKDLKFDGDMFAVAEGIPVFPQQPIIRVHARRIQAQLVETALLNIINFQTMIASKTSRIVTAAQGSGVIDFGLRRAHECDAGIKGSRAAFIAGAVATSNVLAGKEYNIPIAGTHAHSFIMAFKTELEAFRAYIKIFNEKPSLLIDTYSTLQGARNACIAAGELEARGKKLGSVRLDSGDIAKLSKKVRHIFDEAGFPYIKIIASNDLNEYKIDEFKQKKAPIDLFGVGTELITAKPVAAISGVYKLVQDNGGPKIKLSDDKQTLPGIKQIYRFCGSDNMYKHDSICLDTESMNGQPLLEPVVKNGIRIRQRETAANVRKRCVEAVEKLPSYLKELRVNKNYPVHLSTGIKKMISKLTKEYGGGIN